MSSVIDLSSGTDISSLSSASTSLSCRHINNQRYLDSYIYEKKKLSEERLGVMSNLHIAIVHENDNDTSLPLQYSSQDLCSVLHKNKNIDIKAYFHQNHLVCKEVNTNIDIDNIVIDKTSSPRITLVGALQDSALNGRDKITINGYNRKSKYIIQYF